ncbi:integrase, catalytic region, zinc finger, CCHC-type containing protein [Tanacetum coccineum]
MKIEDSLNVTFNEIHPPSKTSPLVDDDLDEDKAIRVIKKKNLENDIEDETLEIDKVVNIKESRNHPLENVIGNLNQRTLRLESIRILLAYACSLDFKLFQMDVKSAFLNGLINEETLSYVGNCSTGNDHIARPYTQSKKIQCLQQQMLLTQLQEAGIQLSKDQLAILADIGERIDFGPGAFTVTTNALFQPDGVETYTPRASGSNSRKQRIVICYNCKWKGYMSKQCTKPKRKRDDSWFKDKVLQVQDQVNDQILHEEELAFLADPGIAKVQLQEAGIQLSKDQLAILADTGERINFGPEKESLMKTVTVLKDDFKKEESRNIDREIALEKKIKHLDNIVYKRDQSAQTVHLLTKPKFFYDHSTKQALGFQNPFYLKKAQQLEPKFYDSNVIKNTSAIVIPDSEETLILVEESRSKMLLKQQDPEVIAKKVNTTPVDYATLNKLSQYFKK